MIQAQNVQQKMATVCRAFLGSPLFRPVLLLLILAVVGGIVFAGTHGKPDPYATARKTADNFVQAYANCDFKALQGVFLTFQTPDNTAAAAYQQQCTKSVYHFTFVRQLTIAAKDTHGAKLQSVGYQYALTSTRAKGTAQVVVDLEWSAAKHAWQVFNLAPASSASKQ